MKLSSFLWFCFGVNVACHQQHDYHSRFPVSAFASLAEKNRVNGLLQESRKKFPQSLGGTASFKVSTKSTMTPSMPLSSSLVKSRLASSYGNLADMVKLEEDGIYGPFAEYVWEKLQAENLIEVSLPVPDIQKLSEPKNAADTTQVRINVKQSHSFLNDEPRKALRYGRFAHLETINRPKKFEVDYVEGGTRIISNSIHVLNLVLFPNYNLSVFPPLPILGIDMVTLPGNKHLIAIDFQRILSSTYYTLLPEQYQDFEARLKQIHQYFVTENQDILPWGGDIPEEAQRYFSPYALWTRLGGDKDDVLSNVNIIHTHVWQAFCAYVDLYIELLITVEYDLASRAVIVDDDIYKNSAAVEGQQDYLKYRKENDPAKPMLNRLYGPEWCEKLLEKVLFPPIQL